MRTNKNRHLYGYELTAILDAFDAAERERDEAKWLVDVGAGEMALLDLEVEKTKRERDEARAALATARRNALEEAEKVLTDMSEASMKEALAAPPRRADILEGHAFVLGVAGRMIRILKDRTP